MLFIPGNAGSYKQVRPIAADAANHFQQQHRGSAYGEKSGVRNLDFFTVDFNEDITAFHGQTLLDQAEYLNEAVRFILSLYSDPQRASRDSDLPDPTSVIIVGHSMGGVVARAMLVQPNYLANSINTILTMSAPHARAPVTFDGQLVQIYDEINEYWRHAYAQKWANNNPLWHVTLVSIAGGSLDSIVPSDYASLESLVPPTHGFTVFTTGIPTVWTAMDHQAILWCDQFRKVVSRALLDIVDVHRASQTKPRAERMRVFKKAFLSGLESVAEKTGPVDGATTLLTLSAASKHVAASDGVVSLEGLGDASTPKAHLIPVPQPSLDGPNRFSLLTDAQLEEAGKVTQLDVLLCTVSPSQHPAVPSSHFSASIDLSGSGGPITTLACRNAAADRILLPASTATSKTTFCLERDCQTPMFSYLQYEVEDLYDHQFIAVVDRTTDPSSKFVLTELSAPADYRQIDNSSLTQLITVGTTLERPNLEKTPMVVEFRIPSLKSALLAYDLDVSQPQCKSGHKALFQPFVRQYLERPYESRYFVNVDHASVTLHGAAPYMPGALEPRRDDGLTLQFWSDLSCVGPFQLRLRVNILASLGKLYMRYRTVFAAFPLLIVALILRQQFRAYDNTGIFISFSQALDLALRQSIPLLLLSLTLLSLSVGSAATAASGLLHCTHSTKSTVDDFHENELLVGTRDPFFWFLIPLIGIVCVGVCVGLHYAALAVTHIGTLLYWAVGFIRHSSTSTGRTRAPSPAFVPSTPRRRMITTVVLLFLVATFIPYQFAYLVACLVQLFTVTRALRIQNNISSTGNNNYYNYAHSILLLMLWVLPINLPILAVWIRNLAVHWLTPFSSHHNVLSIMPFILLVENLTTGKMVPQVTSGLRFVTSVLLFGTALCAAVYGVSHAYLLHYLVNVVAAWLVVVHSTAESWSLARLSAMFEVNPDDARNRGKRS